MIDSNPKNAVTKSIIVELDAPDAFRVWTEQINQWWPAGHSMSGDPDTKLFIEASAGGRFYERASNGMEHVWGAVEIWEPPDRLAFSWYLGSSREMPTRVEVQFVSLDGNRTRIELEHRGPELIGRLWQQRVAIFNSAWDKVLSGFAQFITF